MHLPTLGSSLQHVEIPEEDMSSIPPPTWNFDPRVLNFDLGYSCNSVFTDCSDNVNLTLEKPVTFCTPFARAMDKLKGKDKWLPLEANPQVMNKYVSKLGMVMNYQFHDVFGLDAELLAMIPQPCVALLLLFPINKKVIDYEEEQKRKIAKDGQTVSSAVYFTKQTIGNACEDGFLKTFFEKTKDMSPEERAQYLEEDEPPAPEEDVNLHFICLVQQGGHLYELDGRKDYPINHGATTPENFLMDAAKVCQGFMARDPTELKFTVVALGASS